MASQAPERLFFSVNEAAQMTGLSPAHLRSMCLRGELKAQRFGEKLWRIPRIEIYRLAGEALPEGAHDALSSPDERAEQLRSLRRLLHEAQRILDDLDGA